MSDADVTTLPVTELNSPPPVARLIPFGPNSRTLSEPGTATTARAAAPEPALSVCHVDAAVQRAEQPAADVERVARLRIRPRRVEDVRRRRDVGDLPRRARVGRQRDLALGARRERRRRDGSTAQVEERPADVAADRGVVDAAVVGDDRLAGGADGHGPGCARERGTGERHARGRDRRRGRAAVRGAVELALRGGDETEVRVDAADRRQRLAGAERLLGERQPGVVGAQERPVADAVDRVRVEAVEPVDAAGWDRQRLPRDARRRS